MLDYRIKLIIL